MKLFHNIIAQKLGKNIRLQDPVKHIDSTSHVQIAILQRALI